MVFVSAPDDNSRVRMADEVIVSPDEFSFGKGPGISCASEIAMGRCE
jgi:hypothetical protein